MRLSFRTEKTPNFSACEQNVGSPRRERVERAKGTAVAHVLANPLTLEALGQEVGCVRFISAGFFRAKWAWTIPHIAQATMDARPSCCRTGANT